MGERILLTVHLEAAKDWATNPLYRPSAYMKNGQEIVERIEAEQHNYSMTVSFDHDPWRPEWNPDDPSFSWEEVVERLGVENEINIAGVQRYLCVQKVAEELTRRGMNVVVREDLTWDSESG